jgi:predicted dehydrogenase
MNKPDHILKIALVGCGKIADAHVEEIQKQKSVRLVAVCDSELLMAEQLATRYGIPKYHDDFAELLSTEAPDVVHIATPPQSHLALATQAMKADCHVFVEKPLTLDYDSSKTLLDTAVRTGKKVTVGFIAQFDPPAERMRALLHAGALGEPVHVESFYGYNLLGPYGSAFMSNPNHWVHQLPGKLFHNVIDHCVNKLCDFIADENPELRVVAYSRNPSPESFSDELRVLVQGQRVSAYCTISAGTRPTGHFLRVYGTKRTLHVDYVTRTVTFDPAPSLPSAIGRLLPAFGQARQYRREAWRNVRRFMKSEYHFFAGLNRLIALFYESIRTNGDPPISYRDILWVSRITDRIFNHVDEHSRVPEHATA